MKSSKTTSRQNSAIGLKSLVAIFGAGILAVNFPKPAQSDPASPYDHDRGFFENESSFDPRMVPSQHRSREAMPDIEIKTPAPTPTPQQKKIKNAALGTDGEIRSTANLTALPKPEVPGLGPNQNSRQLDKSTRKMMGPVRQMIQNMSRPSDGPVVGGFGSEDLVPKTTDENEGSE